MALPNQGLRDFDALPSFWPRNTIPAGPNPPALPLDIEDRYPAEVDMSIPITEEGDTSHIRLADGIATFLIKYNRSFMVQFFDLESPSEFFSRKKKELYESTELIIKRNTNVVTVGWCTIMMTESEVINGVLRKPRLFRDYDTVVKFCIQNAGYWTPMSAQDELTNHEWSHDPEMVDRVGSKVAKMLLMSKEWEKEEGVTIKTSINDHFEQTKDIAQPASSSFQRTSALFRQAEQKGDTIRLSSACFDTAEERQIREASKAKAGSAEDGFLKRSLIKKPSKIFRDIFTGNSKSKEHIVQAEDIALEDGAQAMESLVFQTSALDVQDTNVHANDAGSSATTLKAPEGRVVKKRTMEDMFARAWGITRKKTPSTDSLGGQSKASKGENSDQRAINDSFVQAHDAEASGAKLKVIEGRVVKKRTMEDIFAEAWGIPRKKAPSTDSLAIQANVLNASKTDSRVAEDSFVQAGGAEVPAIKIQDVDGQVVKKRTMRDE
ncbi:hypothetical protein MMC26_000765 [Xylographa opegraphella]|nr:hypothetical protein [Xylographa opegraphella]